MLENNLIKRYQPRYNVQLKDDKTYPSICITNEEFPRVFKTRNIIQNGSQYFGRYSSVSALNLLLDTIRELYLIRTCKLPLTRENIKAGKFKVCLQYHIHKCNGPCEGKETVEEYQKISSKFVRLFKAMRTKSVKCSGTKCNNLLLNINLKKLMQ